jgi:hypothetical protein
MKIERGARPVPAAHPLRKYNWDDMQPGDHFTIEFEPDQRRLMHTRQSVSVSAKKAGVRIVTRKCPEGLCVWRTE